jgi:TetR/AcrR family transcriptional repressor of bet genes
MPRIGAEPERRRALIIAAIDAIGEHGSLDVSVKEIARQAGMSSSLAFHYFGGKDEIITETMRHLLRELTGSMTAGLKAAKSPMARIDAVIQSSFAAEQFERRTIAAWLVFYLHAYSSEQAARLLTIYSGRLNSNLVSGLSKLTDRKHAYQVAAGLGALIDGIYIRQGLSSEGPDANSAIELCRDYVFSAVGIKSANPNLH